MHSNVLFGSAVLAALLFAGCQKDDEDEFNLINTTGASGNNAVVSGTNDTDNEFIRGFETPRSTQWKQAYYKISISKNSTGTMGLIFDETKVPATETEEAKYDFYNFAVTVSGSHPAVYLSRFENVLASQMTGTGRSFGDELEMINGGDYSSTHTYYKTLSSVNADSENNFVIYAGYKQLKNESGNWTGRYQFGAFATEEEAEEWWTADDYTTMEDKRLIKTFDSSASSSTAKLFTTEYSGSTINNFGIEAAGTTARQTQVAFYAMIPKGCSLSGSWDCTNRDLSDEVVEE